MLKKLLKYDILSMFPYYLMCAAVCVGLAIVTRLMFLIEPSTKQAGESVLFIGSQVGTTVLLVIACCAVLAFAALFPAVRFYRNLLRDEGYLMFTLPVTPTELYFSKLLSALFGILFMGLTVFACFCITFLTQPEIAN